MITKHGYTCGSFRPRGKSHVVLELQFDSALTVEDSGFAAGTDGTNGLRAIERVLTEFGVKRVRPLFTRTKRERADRARNPSPLTEPVTAAFAHAGFAQVFPRRAGDTEALAKRLNRLGSVWKAQPAPTPVPAGAVPDGPSLSSRNFEPAQGYLHSGPYGIGSLDLRALDEPGWDGKGVTICDIETDWNLTHQDVHTMREFGGDPVGTHDARSHGIAVMGILLAKRDKSGLIGMVPSAKGAVHSALFGTEWNTAEAINRSAARLDPGDVIIIELQASPDGVRPYVAMQYWDAVFSAIRAATDKGIVVVEAAGNGGENFDKAFFKGSGLQKDSGAIVVGAGVPPTNFIGFEGDAYGFEKYDRLGAPRSRLWFSNYGKIVNVQAWGWNVTTLGYGDAQGGAEGQWYTHRFSGTSSAAPIIAGAVASIQSRAMQFYGQPLTPAEVRDVLIRSGAEQADGDVPARDEHIGPQPDLRRAIDLF